MPTEAIDERYFALLEAAQARKAQMPLNLHASLVTTAANARYLVEQSEHHGDVCLLYGGLRLFEAAEEILCQWDADPSVWAAPVMGDA
jgi:hypothetical protein